MSKIENSVVKKITEYLPSIENKKSVRDKILKRADFGLEKYGVTLEREDLCRLDWLNHLQQELMDALNYSEVLFQKKYDSEIEDMQKVYIKHILYIENLIWNEIEDEKAKSAVESVD